MLPFQIAIYHPILSNNCNNVFPPVLSTWSCSGRTATIYCIVYTRHNQLKTDYQNNKMKIYQTPRNWSHPWVCSCFSALSMFTFDAFWGILGTSIFGNSSSAGNNTRARLPSRLSFCFFWLWSSKTPNQQILCIYHRKKVNTKEKYFM